MVKVLIVLVVILAVIAIAQLTRVYELTAKLRNKKEEDISDGDNNMQGYLMLLFMILFYAFFFWLYFDYGSEVLNKNAASKHGAEVDTMLNFNFVILFVVFFITQTLLFYFAWRYRGKKGMKALFYPHNNKLELVWTIIPAIVLAVIIIYGLKTWHTITEKAGEDAITIEVYGKQFDWTIRYPGIDGKLGKTNFNLITPQNPLGIITTETIAAKVKDIEETRAELKEEIESKGAIMPDHKLEAKEDKLAKLKRQKASIEKLDDGEVEFKNGYDDRIVNGEFHMPVDQEVQLVIRSRDVIHSAYLPHLRAQMNAVPGMKTHFKFTPTITTDSMRTIKEDPEFNYTMLCNKICGAAHYNMKMDYVIEELGEYDKWLFQQEKFSASLGLEGKGKEEDQELASNNE